MRRPSDSVRQPAWRRFEHFLIAIEGSQFAHLTEQEVSEFSELFRAICYDLATVRSREWGAELERYLNDLADLAPGRIGWNARRVDHSGLLASGNKKS